MLADYVSAQTKAHFAELTDLLDAAGIAYIVNPKLVRGLDYYNNMVFEWITDTLGAQGTVCAGGRYDGLVEQLGGRATPGVGFAMGIERLVLMLQELDLVPAALTQVIDVYVAIGEGMGARAIALAETMRSALPALRVQLNCGGGKMNNQLKKAFNSGATHALVIEADEQGQLSQVKLRQLGDEPTTEQVPVNELLSKLKQHFPNA